MSLKEKYGNDPIINAQLDAIDDEYKSVTIPDKAEVKRVAKMTWLRAHAHDPRAPVVLKEQFALKNAKQGARAGRGPLADAATAKALRKADSVRRAGIYAVNPEPQKKRALEYAGYGNEEYYKERGLDQEALKERTRNRVAEHSGAKARKGETEDQRIERYKEFIDKKVAHQLELRVVDRSVAKSVMPPLGVMPTEMRASVAAHVVLFVMAAVGVMGAARELVAEQEGEDFEELDDEGGVAVQLAGKIREKAEADNLAARADWCEGLQNSTPTTCTVFTGNAHDAEWLETDIQREVKAKAKRGELGIKPLFKMAHGKAAGGARDKEAQQSLTVTFWSPYPAVTAALRRALAARGVPVLRGNVLQPPTTELWAKRVGAVGELAARDFPAFLAPQEASSSSSSSSAAAPAPGIIAVVERDIIVKELPLSVWKARVALLKADAAAGVGQLLILLGYLRHRTQSVTRVKLLRAALEGLGVPSAEVDARAKAAFKAKRDELVAAARAAGDDDEGAGDVVEDDSDDDGDDE